MSGTKRPSQFPWSSVKSAWPPAGETRRVGIVFGDVGADGAFSHLFRSHACHAGLAPAYPFGPKEKTGTIQLQDGPSRPAHHDPSPPARGFAGLLADPLYQKSGWQQARGANQGSCRLDGARPSGAVRSAMGRIGHRHSQAASQRSSALVVPCSVKPWNLARISHQR